MMSVIKILLLNIPFLVSGSHTQYIANPLLRNLNEFFQQLRELPKVYRQVRELPKPRISNVFDFGPSNVNLTEEVLKDHTEKTKIVREARQGGLRPVEAGPREPTFLAPREGIVEYSPADAEVGSIETDSTRFDSEIISSGVESSEVQSVESLEESADKTFTELVKEECWTQIVENNQEDLIHALNALRLFTKVGENDKILDSYFLNLEGKSLKDMNIKVTDLSDQMQRNVLHHIVNIGYAIMDTPDMVNGIQSFLAQGLEEILDMVHADPASIRNALMEWTKSTLSSTDTQNVIDMSTMISEGVSYELVYSLGAVPKYVISKLMKREMKRVLQEKFHDKVDFLVNVFTDGFLDKLLVEVGTNVKDQVATATGHFLATHAHAATAHVATHADTAGHVVNHTADALIAGSHVAGHGTFAYQATNGAFGPLSGPLAHSLAGVTGASAAAVLAPAIVKMMTVQLAIETGKVIKKNYDENQKKQKLWEEECARDEARQYDVCVRKNLEEAEERLQQQMEAEKQRTEAREEEGRRIIEEVKRKYEKVLTELKMKVNTCKLHNSHAENVITLQ